MTPNCVALSTNCINILSNKNVVIDVCRNKDYVRLVTYCYQLFFTLLTSLDIKEDI